MRGVLLFILLTIPALFVFGCVSTDVAEPTKTGETTATGKGLNYHLSINGNSELSYWDIISELREFGEEVDVERGLTGLNENGISENTATFSAGPEISIDAFSRALELIVESKIYKANIQLLLSDDRVVRRYLELPKDEGFSWVDRTGKIHIRIDADGNTVMFEAWVGPNDYLSVPEEEVVFPDNDPGIVWPELDPPPTDDFDEDPIASRP